MSDSKKNEHLQPRSKFGQLFIVNLLRLFLGSILLFFVLAAFGLGAVRLWLGPEIESTITSKEKFDIYLPKVLLKHNIEISIQDAKIDWGKWLTPNLILNNIEITKNSDEILVHINELESELNFKSIVSFLNRNPVSSNLKMDIVSISFDKKNIKNKVFLAGLPILFSSNEIDQADKDLLRYSPNKIEINKLLIYQNNIDQIDKIENLPINMGAILIKNDSDQVKLIFKEIHTESLMSVVPTTGKLNEKDVIFEGFFKELMFKLPKFNNEYNDKVLESLILEGRFEQLGIEKPDSQTRFSGLNGSFILDSSDLYFEFFSENASIFTTEKFPYSDLGVLAVDGKLGIKTPKIKQFLEGKKLKVPINIFKLNLSNSDLKIESKGLLNLDSFSSQSIEIQGEVVFKNPKKIPYYLPKKIGKKTRNWLERGIVSADSVVGSFFYEGPLRSFSGSSDTENTKLEANFFVQNLDLVFSSRWPRIEGINTVITFQNSNFKIINATGFLNETKLSSINGEISNIFSKLPKLLLNGNITGSLDSFIEVSNNSPLEKWLWGVTKTASGEGNTSLNLTLNLDLKKIKNSSFNGNLFFENTEISFAENFLPLKEARGKITFTNKLISKIDIKGELLGGNIEFTNVNKASLKKGIFLSAKGEISGQKLENWLTSNSEISIQEKIYGDTKYNSEIKLFKDFIEVQVSSNLEGITINLPYPLGKDSSKNLKLSGVFLQEKILQDGVLNRTWNIRTNNGLLFLVNQAKSLSSQNRIKLSKGNKFTLVIDDKKFSKITEKNLKDFPQQQSNKISLHQTKIDLENWKGLIYDANNSSINNFFNILDNKNIKFDLFADELKLGNKIFDNIKIKTLITSNGWAGIFSSYQTTGVFNWTKEINKLNAHFSHLHIDKKTSESTESDELFDFDESYNWPSLSIFVDDFKSFKFQGKLAVEANYLKNQRLWDLEKIEIFSKSTRLEASGFWRKFKKNITTKIPYPNGASSNKTITELDFRLDTKNGSNLLDKFGYPDLLAGSGGIVSGQLKWLGSPLDFKIKNTSGDLSLDIQKGKFLKVEPGLARLIGVLNLQSLPRRIKLDFEDIFSEGFSFDKIRGDVSLQTGTANTKNLRVIGTQASIFLEGDVEILNQTQNMRVLVLPELNAGLASLGYVLVNPAVGLGSFIAQYILRDPLRKILAFEYKLKGSWDSPIVESIQQKKPNTDESSIYQNPLEN